ncbi:MAG: FkbM family methyltransferase [Burkholderiales bacterium]|nr:FkbM family methyltransferase [Burkholderiales bacterium]
MTGPPHGSGRSPFAITTIVPQPPPITIIDVGAMDIGPPAIWQPLLDAGLATVIGFEPVAAECARLNAAQRAGQRYLPYALGDGRQRTLHVTRFSACSSLYEPNPAFVELFDDLAPAFDVLESVPVQTRRLDDIEEIAASGCDYLKLDIQGAEFDTLRHATRVLTGTLVVESEVLLAPLYRDAPGFAEIDGVLAANGFVFHQWRGSGGRTLKPMHDPRGLPAFLSQTLWADLLYVKNFCDPDAQPPENWLKLAVIAHTIYGAADLAHLALCHADTLAGTWFAADYRDACAEPAVPPAPQPSTPGLLSRLLGRR